MSNFKGRMVVRCYATRSFFSCGFWVRTRLLEEYFMGLGFADGKFGGIDREMGSFTGSLVGSRDGDFWME